MKNKKFGIITIAFGDDYYIQMAISLGQSLRRFSPEIPCAIVTDSDNKQIAQNFTHIIPINSDWGENVVQKLFIDKYTPFDKTLFIDSDSITVKNLSFVFNLFEDKNVVFMGTEFFYPGDECSFANINIVCKELNIEKIPRFNGGVYYIGFYPEFNGMITFEQKDVYRKSFHKTAPIGGRMDC